MTDWREELVEKMAMASWYSDGIDSAWENADEDVRELFLEENSAALAVAEPVIREQVEFELRVKNVCVHGTSHPEIYKTAEDDLREELAAAQSVIADLTKIATTLNVRTSKLNVLREENARLSSEATLLREALGGWQKWWALPWQDRRLDMADVCWKRSRIAIREGGKDD